LISSKVSVQLRPGAGKGAEAHGGKFEDIFDFAANIPRRLINIGKIRVLLRSKALDSIISEEDRKKLVLHLETKKKFPTSEKQYKDIDASAYVETDVLAYEMPEEYLTQNKALVELLSRHFRVKKLSYLSGRENEAYRNTLITLANMMRSSLDSGKRWNSRTARAVMWMLKDMRQTWAAAMAYLETTLL